MALDPEHEAMKREAEREQAEERRKDQEYEKTLREKPTLGDYRKQIKPRTHEQEGDDKCTCGYPGLSKLPIEHFDHSGGWPVRGFQVLQWLYVTCPKCGYQWVLWKLGVPR